MEAGETSHRCLRHRWSGEGVCSLGYERRLWRWFCSSLGEILGEIRALEFDGATYISRLYAVQVSCDPGRLLRPYHIERAIKAEGLSRGHNVHTRSRNLVDVYNSFA